MAYDPIPFVDAAGVAVWSAKVAGDSNNRAQITADGQMSWGPGNAAVDTHMSRSGVATVSFGEVAGAGAHTISIYNSFTDASNFSRFDIAAADSGITMLSRKLGSGVQRNVIIATLVGGTINFRTNNNTRWLVDSNGHFVSGSDNGFDQGIVGARIRSIYWGTQALGPVGAATSGNVSYSFSGDDDMGWFRQGADTMAFSSNGVGRWLCGNSLFQMRSDYAISWTSGNYDGTRDLFLFRDAANTLAQRNGVNAQVFRVYNTFTSSTDHELLKIEWSGDACSILTDEGSGGGTARNLTIGVDGSASLNLRANGSNRWQMTSSGHFNPVTDNVYDQGNGSARIRSIYWGTQALAPDGTAAAPSISFAAVTSTGIFRAGADDSVNIARLGIAQFAVKTNFVGMQSNVLFGWGSSATVPSTNLDVVLARDAAGILAQRNGTNPQVHRWYGTFTNSSNYERFTITTSAGVTDLLQEQAGTGTARGLRIGPSGNGSMLFHSNSTDHFRLTGGGNLTWDNDNANDIGADDATRPRSGFFGTSISIGTGVPTSGGLRLANATAIIGRNAADSAQVVMMTFTGSDVINVGGGSTPITFDTSGTVTMGTGTTAFRGIASFSADNLHDIGATATTLRPRTGFFGTSVNVVNGSVLLDTNGITMGDAKNIIFNATTGTKIGTATTQKFAFWNSTPVVQPVHIVDPTGGSVIDIECRAQLVLLLADQATLGLQAAA